MYYIYIIIIKQKHTTMKTLEITTDEMKSKIEAAILKVQNIGYSRKEAEKMIEKALKLVAEGKKKITDVIDL